MVRRLVSEVKKPFVIDADGINAFTGHLNLLKKAKAEVVMTPHPGEFARIMGITPQNVNADRIGIAPSLLKNTVSIFS